MNAEYWIDSMMVLLGLLVIAVMWRKVLQRVLHIHRWHFAGLPRWLALGLPLWTRKATY